MPKRQILNLPGVLHFITFSTYQRRCFLSPEGAKNIVLETLQKCLETHDAACAGFVLMPNHVHVILRTESPISAFLQVWKKSSSYRLKRFYAEKLNSYFTECPTDCPVWQPRFYDYSLLDTDKLNEKLDYIHNNPVTAQLVKTPTDWNWSSARFYELGEPVGVTITPIL